MRKRTAPNYPLEILLRTQTTLEINLKGVPGMLISADKIPTYDKQLKELKKAIEYLKLHERIENRKRIAAKQKLKITNTKK